MKFEVNHQFFLVLGIALSLLIVVASGISMWLGFPFAQAIDSHLFIAGITIFGLILHFYGRNKKWVKINTQFADLIRHNRMSSYCNLDRLMMTFEHFPIQQIVEQVNLSLPILLNELSQAEINITDPQRILCENFDLNVEKILAAIIIAL